MASILDIAPPEGECVTIRGVELEIRGINNLDMAALMKRFPALRQQLLGAASQDDDTGGEFDFMPAIIATAMGKRDDAETEAAIIERLVLGEQMRVFRTIMKLTMPEAPTGPLPDQGAAPAA